MIVLRYPSAFRPILTGLRPFIVKGENFLQFRETIEALLETVDQSLPRLEQIRFIAEFLLIEGVVEAAWLETTTLDDEARWEAGIQQLVENTPDLSIHDWMTQDRQYLISRGFNESFDLRSELLEMGADVTTFENRESFISKDPEKLFRQQVPDHHKIVVP